MLPAWPGITLHSSLTLRRHQGPVNEAVSTLIAMLLKASVGLFVVNEIRGFVLAAPVLYAMYAAGGTLMAIWVAVCSLAGIALSIIGPLFVVKKLTLV